MLDAKEMLKNDVEHILDKIKSIHHEVSSLFDEEDAYIRIYLYDFNTYRKMVLSLFQTYDSLSLQYDNNLYKEDEEFVISFISRIKFELSFIEMVKDNCKENHNQYRCLQDICLKINNYIHNIYKTNVKYEPKSKFEYIGEKDKAKLQAIVKENFECTNENIKFTVLPYNSVIQDNILHVADWGSFIPFLTAKGAESYINTELEPLGIHGLILSINE